MFLYFLIHIVARDWRRSERKNQLSGVNIYSRNEVIRFKRSYFKPNVGNREGKSEMP